MLSVTGSIPASELIIVGGDLNGHVGTNVDGYDGVHGGYGFGDEDAIRYGIKPKQQVIRVNTRRQDEIHR